MGGCLTDLFGMDFRAGDGAHSGELATAVDALLDPAARDGDGGIALHEACQLHGGGSCRRGRRGINNSQLGGVVAAEAAAVHVAPDGAAADGDCGVVVFRCLDRVRLAAQYTQLAAAEDGALDDGFLAGALADVEGSVLYAAE